MDKTSSERRFLVTVKANTMGRNVTVPVVAGDAKTARSIAISQAQSLIAQRRKVVARSVVTGVAGAVSLFVLSWLFSMALLGSQVSTSGL